MNTGSSHAGARNFLRAPKGGTILKQGGSTVVGARGPLSVGARAAMLRARVGAVQVEIPGDFAREMGGVGGGCGGNGITEADMNVAGPEARCEQAEEGYQATAVHPEQQVLVVLVG